MVGERVDGSQCTLDKSRLADAPSASHLGKKPTLAAKHFRQDGELIFPAVKSPGLHDGLYKVKPLYLR
jgi:hypothetical protein